VAKRKGGKTRVTEKEANRRRDTIEAAILREGHCTGRLRRALADKWGIGTKMVDHYVRQVADRMASNYVPGGDEPQDPLVARARQADTMIARLRSAQVEMARAGRWGAWGQAMRLEATILGVEAATRSEVKHTGGISIEGLSDEQAARLAAALGDED
jgi:hypothetical protein